MAPLDGGVTLRAGASAICVCPAAEPGCAVAASRASAMSCSVSSRTGCVPVPSEASASCLPSSWASGAEAVSPPPVDRRKTCSVPIARTTAAAASRIARLRPVPNRLLPLPAAASSRISAARSARSRSPAVWPSSAGAFCGLPTIGSILARVPPSAAAFSGLRASSFAAVLATVFAVSRRRARRNQLARLSLAASSPSSCSSLACC